MVATKELLMIDAATHKEIKRIKLENTPLGIVFGSDGRTAFVSAAEPNTVLKVNIETGEVTGRLDVGNDPDGIAVAGI